MKLVLSSCLVNGGLACKRKKSKFGFKTQMNVRSSILSLTKRYRTEILSHKLSRLSVKFYTDTLFDAYNSLRGNKCSQIYSDGEVFAHVFPVRSKAGAGDSMGNVVKDIGTVYSR